MFDSCLRCQLSFFEELDDVMADRRDRHLIQLGELLLGQPDGAVVQAELDTSEAILGRFGLAAQATTSGFELASSGASRRCAMTGAWSLVPTSR